MDKPPMPRHEEAGEVDCERLLDMRHDEVVEARSGTGGDIGRRQRRQALEALDRLDVAEPFCFGQCAAILGQ